MEKKYWQSFGELNNTDAYQQETKDEFREELPFESADNGFLEAKTPRRDFLKYLGFSTAAAAIAASCEVPVKKAIPFANKPEDIIPGVANYYATTYTQEGDAISVLAKVRDGRPIKIEGNDLNPITGGGTSARVQASVLDLYDGARLRFPTIQGKESTFDAIDKEIVSELSKIPSASVVLLTPSLNSPSSLEVVKQFQAKFPGSKHIMYDTISYSGILQANEATYGKRAIPSYRFDKAKVIVSISADFLGTWLSPVEFAKQYAIGRKLKEKQLELSKHIHFETVATLTGSNADERYLSLPSEIGKVAVGILDAINGKPVNGIEDKQLIAGIEKAAKVLAESKGESLVVSGSNDTNVQIVVNAINEALQANGKTIDWNTTFNSKKALDSDFTKLVDEMNAGTVGALIINEVNPVYSWVDSAKFKEGLSKVKLTVSFNSKADETTELVKYSIPSHHYLESWGDTEVKTNHFSFLQPTIYPLFKTRQWQDSLLKWVGSTNDYLTVLKNGWISKLGAEAGWDKVLQDGIQVPTSTTIGTASFNSASVLSAITSINATKKGGALELVLYEKVAVGATGYNAANPWLQEMPDPVSKATWDNYVIISPALAKKLLNIDLNNNGQADAYEVQPPKHLVDITVNGKTYTLPALIIPGTHQNTVGIALGYGRSPKIGKAVVDDKGIVVGANVFPISSLVNNTVSYYNCDVTLKDTGKKYPVALTQTHNLYDTKQGKRTEVMKELTLSELKAHPDVVLEDREEEVKPFGGLEKYKEQGTIYKIYDRPGIKWGMSIDLNACNGCGACVVACTAENNVAVVGKPEVLRAHEMHWLRIDRYYSGDLDNPNVVFQPLMCQHCDNAPCENVCPVAATNHSSEGLNQMTYNRCIGTRYCANNCPYKVRRFNWADYTGADSFPDNQDELNNVVHLMNDDLTRMILNPDVTVRSRGVIEKCSFCVQRLQDGKLKAKKESRPLKSGENDDWDVKSACQQACPTEAIVFGNANDVKSKVSTHRAENNNRIFYSLEQLHVLPNVSYLAKVRNIDEEKATEKKEG